MKSKLLLCLIFITPFAFGQGQNNIWCFGQNARVDFNSGSPVVLPPTAIYMQEGCSTISDNLGQLLFYTNGVQVWNKNNIQMPNGFSLQGNQSTTQSALIVPMPGSTTQYYVFAIDALSAPMTYSLVDMTLQGGLGDVTAIKNVLLHPLVAEKQCAIQRCDGNIWVISCEYNSNTIFADLITPGGIQPSVLSAVGIVQTGGGGPGYNSVGYLKASQQGNRLALALRDAATFEVFDFDVNTGVVSNPISITNNNWSVLYGVEFSPDGTKLYGSLITSSEVYQFNLMAGTPAAITASATLVATSPAWACGMQLAADGKIYIAQPYAQQPGGQGPSLGCIPSPNTLGVGCGYIPNAVIFSNPYGTELGLQNLMVKSTVLNTVNITGNLSICNGQSTTLTATGGAIYQWSGGSNATTAAITVSPTVTTSYYLQSGTGVCAAYDTAIVQVNPPPVATISGNLTICSGQSTTLTASGATSYQWSGGSTATTAVIIVSSATTTTYTVTPVNGNCIGTPASVTVNVTPLPVAAIASTGNSLCAGQTATLTGSGGTTYQWGGGNNSTSASITVSPAITTTYTLQAVNGSCTDTASVTITVTPVPVGAISGNQSICAGQSTTLTASGATSYQWSGGSTATTAAITVSPAVTTTYSVTPGNGICTGNPVSVTVTVTPVPNGIITPSGTLICAGQTLTLTASGGTTYQWSGGISSASPVVNDSPVSTTTYYLQTSNGMCIDNDSVVINVMGYTLVTGNPVICSGQSTTLTASGATTYLWNNGSTLNSITVSPDSTTNYYVTGTSFCGTSTDTVTITVNPLPVINITNTYTPISIGSSVQLHVTGGISYIWTNINYLNCSTCSDPMASPVVPTLYMVTGTDANGCSNTDTVTIVPAEEELYLPNCITPNEDGNNDVFFAYGINIKTLTMRIFDRWGELIFESNDKRKGWDGTVNGNYVELGVYVYTVQCVWIDGNSKDLRGIVTVVY